MSARRSDQAPAQLRIRLLGELDLRHGEVPVPPLGSAGAESLLAYLLLHREAAQPRQRLAFLLWPDSSEPQSGPTWRHLLHLLRDDPLREATWRVLMRLHDARGDRARALRTYHAGEGAAGVETAYGHRLERLTALKDRYDPANVLRQNANIPPTGRGGQVVER